MADKKDEKKTETKLVGLQNLYSPTPVIPNCKLPDRFAKPGQFKYKKAKQHPMYRTSANDFGSRAPVAEETPTQYHGLNGNFTKEFSGGMYKNEGLVTSTATKNVEDMLKRG
uniref:Uncharacterized protein n=1 Tax=Lotharella oceanica TaxID=641309 RepID=A0A7S2TP34_9EUKA|mmetsp:Transcript_23190/g.43454  ORF Transcript_23190/g.43454 Transcript_23190/m.43454 type:complete len:112 (+) Transcript_23190:44-379(+)